ncbi:1451_t:CDS:2 [Cetraspora pellucida]|uniref:1451_t:CDS:1 n=1 Tax=Cetraspora pellucida TaxID=1433469 RepID=A0A9N9FWU2_9GLOM|nr:1451_t:CDS:2 [Cetraspora pellucida]
MELKQKPEVETKKIRAVKIIQQKWIEIMYKPNGLKAKELAEHYKLLWAVREEMHQHKNLLSTNKLQNLFIFQHLLQPQSGWILIAISLENSKE